MAEVPPFTGEYPSPEQVEEALKYVGYQQHTMVDVVSPFDPHPGPLRDQLTLCRSEHLSQGWPAMFKVVVGQMLKQAGAIT